MNDDDATVPVTPRIPKYKAPDFMRKEMALWMSARGGLAAMRRYGDNDAPISPIAPLRGVRSIRPVRGIDGTIR